MTTLTGPVCDSCKQPAGSPVARLRPGDKTSPLVGVSHESCFAVFLDTAVRTLIVGASR